jgi:hypothetical protein
MHGREVDVPLRGARGRLILAGVPWVTSWFPSILLGYNMESLSKLDYLVLYTKLSSCLWAHKSGRAGSTDRSAGLLVGRARLSGMAETLVGGDQWVPMSHMFLWGDCLKAHLVMGTFRESMGESYDFYRRELHYEGLNGVVTTTIRNIEGIHKLASLSTTLTLNMQL